MPRLGGAEPNDGAASWGASPSPVATQSSASPPLAASAGPGVRPLGKRGERTSVEMRGIPGGRTRKVRSANAKYREVPSVLQITHWMFYTLHQ